MKILKLQKKISQSKTLFWFAAVMLTAGTCLKVEAASGNWTNNASSVWSAATNWDSNPTIPGTAAGDVIGLTNHITTGRTVTIDQGATNGILNIGDAAYTGAFTLATNGSASDALVFNNNNNGAQINQVATSKGDTISAAIVLADTLAVTNYSTNKLSLSGPILSGSGGQSIIVNGWTGGVSISSGTGLSTFTNGMHLVAGTLIISGGNPVGSGGAVTGGAVGTGTFTIDDGTTINWATGGVGFGANRMVVNGNITFTNSAGRLTLGAPMIFGGQTRTFTTVSSTNATYAVSLTGSNNLGLRFTLAAANCPSPSIDSGTLKLVGSGPWAGVAFNNAMNFTNNAGLEIGNNIITVFNNSSYLGASANTYASATVDTGGYFNIAGTTTAYNQTVNSLSGAGGYVTALNTTAGTATLTITNASGSINTSYSGSIVDGASLNGVTGITAAGVMAVTKSGAGTQTFSGNNSYSGATTISSNGGTLFINGTNTVASGTTGYYVINSGGTLGGNGLIDLSAANLGVTNKSGGIISPGASAGTAGTLTLALGSGVLDISGGLGSAGSLVFDIAGTNSSDKIVLNSGTLNIGSGLLNWNSFAFNNLGGLQAGTYKLITTPNIISGSLGSSLTGVIGTYNGTLALSSDSKSVILTLAAASLPIPSFSSLTPSQTIGAGTVSIALTGKVSASGPVYPVNGESGTVSATINGTQTYGTFTDGVGDFSITFNPSAIPASATPYTITYSYAGDAGLSAAANNTSTTLTVTTNIVWTGAVSTNFETGGNWNTASAPANDLVSVWAVFSGTPTANQPVLTTSRSIGGLSFTTTTGGWILSGTANNVLSLGVNGISTTGQTSGSNIINGTMNVATNQTWEVGTGGNLLLTGNITNSLNTTTNFSVTINASGSLGNVILSPAAGNSVNLTGSNNTASIFEIKSGGYLELGGDGVTAPATTSTNYINNTQTSSSFGTWGINAPGKVRVNSGTWITGDLGKNGADKFTGSLQVNGGTVEFSGARYLGEGTINVSGGTLAVSCVGSGLSNGGRFSLGSSYNAITNTANMNVTGGFVDLAQANLGNSIGAAISTLLNQSGGTIQNGVTVGGGNNGGTAATFSIGGNNVANDFSALTLAGGSFLSAGTIAAAGPAGSPGANNFNFMGGTLAAAGVDMTYLGSSSTATATANQTNSSDNIGILVNYGGTLAPGGDGTVGRTSITGGYAVSNNAAVLAIDIGGTNEATTFQTNSSGYYDSLVTTSNITLGGSLKVNLVAGFTPAATEQYKIIACSYGGPIIMGTFTNLNTTGANGFYLGRVTVAGTTNATFAVTINSLTNTVYLSNYQVASSEATYSTNITATVINGGTTLNIAWPTTHLGWTLQAQTNGLATGLSTNWVDVTGTASVTSTNMPIVPANPAVFYRLRY
jgi:fibronectin-binding autotransporter adhesin